MKDNAGQTQQRLAYSVKEVAELINVSESHVWRLLKKRELQMVRSGYRVLIPVKALEEYLEKAA